MSGRGAVVPPTQLQPRNLLGVMVSGVREAEYWRRDKSLKGNPRHELAPTGERHDRQGALGGEVVSLGSRDAQELGDAKVLGLTADFNFNQKPRPQMLLPTHPHPGPASTPG